MSITFSSVSLRRSPAHSTLAISLPWLYAAPKKPIDTQEPDSSGVEGIRAPAKERFSSASDVAWLSHPLFDPVCGCWLNTVVLATTAATVSVETAKRVIIIIVTVERDWMTVGLQS